jgi:hypothetical protein
MTAPAASSIDRPPPPTVWEATAALPAAVGSIDGKPPQFATIEAAEGGGVSSMDVTDDMVHARVAKKLVNVTLERSHISFVFVCSSHRFVICHL